MNEFQQCFLDGTYISLQISFTIFISTWIFRVASKIYVDTVTGNTQNPQGFE